MTKKGLTMLLLAVSLSLTLTPVSAATIIRPASSGGPVSISRPVSSYGTITYPFRPAPGHENDPVAVSSSRLNGLVWLAWLLWDAEEFVLPYTDVPEDSWFYPGVCYVYQQALMDGLSDTSFAPHELVSRGLAWNVLARMNSVNTQAAPGEEWYEPGRAWAMEHGVTDGANPLDPITLEQWISILWRRAGESVVDVDLSVYSDSALVSDYAQDAMRWALSTGIIQGSNGTLSPQAPLSRAALASIVLELVPAKR